MKNEIENIINSFFLDFDQRKLDTLDKMLFSILLNREMMLFKGKSRKEAAELDRILSRYWDYRNLILNRIARSGNLKGEMLLERLYPPPTRLILLLTHACQLKCRYCRVRKFSGSMPEEIALKAVDLLFTSNRPDLQLQFFGGEPLLRFDLVKKAVEYAAKLNRKQKRRLTFILTTNGIALTPEKVDFFKKHKFLIECSVDGEIENQLKMRSPVDGVDYYSRLLENYKYLFRCGVAHYSISVVMPGNVSHMYENFRHLVKLGFRRLQMNYSLGFFWPQADIMKLFEQTAKITGYLKDRKDIEFINKTSIRREPVVLNAELTVDCDGGVYLESGICLEEDFADMKRKFLVTHIRKAKNISLYASTPFQNFYRLSKVYSDAKPKFRKIILNNIFLGKRYEQFLKSDVADILQK